MPDSGTAKWQALLMQLKLTDDRFVRAMEGASLDRLTVDRKRRLWQFSVQAPVRFQATAVQLLERRLEEAFAHIATVRLSIAATGGEPDAREIADYWPLVLAKAPELSPPLRASLAGQIPRFAGGRIEVSTATEVLCETLNEKYADLLLSLYCEYGFPRLAFRCFVEEETAGFAERQTAFLEETKKADEEIAKKAAEERKMREANAPKGGEGQAVGPFQLGVRIKPDEPLTELRLIQDEERRIAIEGYVFDVDVKELRSGRTLLTAKITDYTDSLFIKMFSRDGDDAAMMARLKKGMWVRARGSIQNDTFLRDLVMVAQDICEVHKQGRQESALEGETRVELHLHTPMSQMDAVTPVERLVAQAAQWGHPAIAITDHANVQAYPDAYAAGQKHGVKILYGLEAYLVDDGVPIVQEEKPIALDEAEFIVFDVETTGLSAAYDRIIEFAAVKVKRGEIIERFERFANPHHALSATTIELTGITDEMVRDAPEIEDVMRDFYAFGNGGIFVAHNAKFDMGFLYEAYKKAGIDERHHPVIDTLELARSLHPELKNHRLNTLAKKFGIELAQHHRAIYDTEATAYLLLHLLAEAKERGAVRHDELNNLAGTADSYKRGRPTHCTLLATDSEGLKNIFRLVSLSHISTFFRVPRITRTALNRHRKGLLVGSGCDKGEVFEGIMQKPLEEVEAIASYYDYLELHPKDVYSHLLELELIRDEWQLEDIMRKMIKLGKRTGLPVVATGNAHYLDETDAQFREILVRSQGGANPLNRHALPKVHFRTTDEMLEAFAFLGADTAREIVVTNTRMIAERIGDIKPIKDELYTPKIEGADEEVRALTYAMAHSLYGDPLPDIVTARIEKELASIIGHGFAVIYLISHKLVKKSLDDGYLVGSRGSVGSSLVATLMEITEVNPLPPHYVCPACLQAEFFTDGSVGSGFDLPDKQCQACGVPMKKEGQDIPFETFLGFKGDKVPDIDLNFSGEYQNQAHDYTKVLFGDDKVFRAGTIGTVAEKTAYGYVKGYASDRDISLKGAEIDRLVQGCTGVKRTTGQHPGGIIVVPDDMDIFDFSPVQYPADAQGADWKTTHFDFHSIHDNLLKLDILGHDDPTVIRMLLDLSGIDPKTIPTDDPDVMKLFSGTESLGVTPEQIECKTGTLGIPEFGTAFVRQMLEETKPSTFSELVQISGLSHGTDVWLKNAQDLIRAGTCGLPEVIGCRDDIMVYLIYQGLEPSLAFKIMESVRKGRGLTPEFEAEMRRQSVPDWYIESCKKIKYMFPKAHAAAYVLMAVRIAYFKVHFPILYYAAYFTVRASDFDLPAMQNGSETIRARLRDINQKGLDALPKEKSLATVLELALEMCERGYSFQPIDLYKSEAAEFVIEGRSLIPPFNAIPGLGTNVALAIVNAREDGEFLSKEDLQQRGRVSRTILDYMEAMGCLNGLPDANQLSLF